MSHQSDHLRRWIVFNIVGVAGFVVQLGALALLLRARVPYLVATAVAVELAVLHNFSWHRQWTWRDRPPSGIADDVRRLWRFHALNGATSLVGNVVIVALLVEVLRVPTVAASAAAVAVCSLVNYLAGDRQVFTSTG